MIDRKLFDQIKLNNGHFASWAVWGNFGKRPNENMDDLDVLDPEKNPALLDVLQPNVMMIGLNVSRGIEGYFKNFHDAGPIHKVRYAFKDTLYYGAYMTDLIKNHIEVNSGVVGETLKSSPTKVEENFRKLRQEMVDLKAERPIIFAFGDKVYSLLLQYLDPGEYACLIKLRHYSYRMNKDKYKTEVIEQIRKAGLPTGNCKGQINMSEKYWDVFVSYKRNPDEELALDLLGALERAGLKCWIAPRDVRGTSQRMIENGIASDGGWDDAIPYAVEHSRTMVIVVSKAAMESKQIQKEIYLGDDVGIQFFPVLIEDVPLERSFKYHLGRAQWINSFTGEGSQRFLNVASEVAGFLGVVPYIEAARPPIVSAAEKSCPARIRRCAACGEDNPDDARFCPSCGARVMDDPPQVENKPTDALPSLKAADQLRLDFWTTLLALAALKTPLHASTKPVPRYYVERGLRRGFTLRYACNAKQSEVGLYIDFKSDTDRKQKNNEAFARLEGDKAAIEAKFGGSLNWNSSPDTIACLIYTTIDGGTDSQRDQWPVIHAAMVDAMMRLHAALPADVVEKSA